MKSLAPPYQNVVSVACKPSSVIGGHLSRPIVTDGFKRNPESIDGPSQSLFRFLLRAGFTSRTSRQAAGELLPHLSTLTRQACGISLLHFPWGRPRRALPGALPCGARTFLTPFGARPPGSLTNGWYYTINAVPCQFFTAKQILHKARARIARPQTVDKQAIPPSSREVSQRSCDGRSYTEGVRYLTRIIRPQFSHST